VESNEVSSVATVPDVTGPTSSWDPYARGCPSRDLLDRIGGKWTVLVLGELARHGACEEYDTHTERVS
jgi:DNA-binding HxlR family transcriptional regulator